MCKKRKQVKAIATLCGIMGWRLVEQFAPKSLHTKDRSLFYSLYVYTYVCVLCPTFWSFPMMANHVNDLTRKVGQLRKLIFRYKKILIEEYLQENPNDINTVKSLLVKAFTRRYDTNMHSKIKSM